MALTSGTHQRIMMVTLFACENHHAIYHLMLDCGCWFYEHRPQHAAAPLTGAMVRCFAKHVYKVKFAPNR